MRLPPGYELVDGPPALEDYLRVRHGSGLSTRSEREAAGALDGSWTFAHVVRDGTAVAMGRVIGDGGWYFHVADMATLPEHQGRGLGRAVLDHLVEVVLDAAPGAYLSLVADPPGRRLYESTDFVDVAPSVGMVRRRPS